MSILHPLDATVMVLMRNLGAACVIVVIESVLGAGQIAWFDRVLAE